MTDWNRQEILTTIAIALATFVAGVGVGVALDLSTSESGIWGFFDCSEETAELADCRKALETAEKIDEPEESLYKDPPCADLANGRTFSPFDLSLATRDAVRIPNTNFQLRLKDLIQASPGSYVAQVEVAELNQLGQPAETQVVGIRPGHSVQVFSGLVLSGREISESNGQLWVCAYR